jgi:hypothetical protein
LNEQSYTVVGILPARFIPRTVSTLTLLALVKREGTFVIRGEGMMLLKAIARLKPA